MRALLPGLFDSNRLGFQIKDAERERLVGKFQDLIKEIAAMPSDPDGAWSIYLGIHPEPGAEDGPKDGVASRHDPS